MKVIFAPLNTKVAISNRRPMSVSEKRVHDLSGQGKVILTIDCNSPTFGIDLQYVFQRNVAEARRENKRVLGVPDLPVGDG